MTERTFENNPSLEANKKEGPSNGLSSEVHAMLDEYKIGEETVKLPGGFQRNEPPEVREKFPAPDLGKNLVPENSAEATSGASARSTYSAAKYKLGEYVGDALDFVVKLGSKAADTYTKNKPWEDYGKDRSLPGRLKDLSRPLHRRFQLEEENLVSSYPPGDRTGQVPGNLVCPKSAEVSRSTDGTCNALGDPAMGAAGTRFQYNTKPDTRYAMDDPPIMEAARLMDRKKFKELPVMDLIGVGSLQGNVHDWMDHGKHQNIPGGFYKIPLPEDHPIRKQHGQTEMLIPKLLIDATRNDADEKAKIRNTYENTVTHWWDASEIYGSDKATSDRLRTHKDGKMILDKDGLLPMGPQGVPDTGFNQNWNPMLEVIHTLYVREHNSIADMLSKAYPQAEFAKWKDKLPEILHTMFGDKLPDKLTDEQYDEFIFGRARLINAAEKAKTHTVDWTPVALNNKTMTDAMYLNYGQEKVGARSKINAHEIGGIWGNKTELAGQPFAMEEDFVQSYQQMHGLIPDSLKIYDHKSGKQISEIPMERALHGNAHKVIQAAGFENVLYSMGVEKSGQITTGNYPNFMRELNIRGNHIDLAAVDILRGREKLLPRYNEYLRQMHEKPVKDFEELIPHDPQLREEVRKIYNNDIEKVDTVVGSLAEWPGRTPKTMGFSTSTFLEFILMASRRVQADRFYTQDFRPEIYTPEGIERIRSLSGMKEIIERNAPELKEAFASRQSAFHPIGKDPIPLNNSGIDELPSNDIQAHIAAFDTKHSGEVSVSDLAQGFRDIGYSRPTAYFKAAMAELRFGSLAGAIGLDKIQIADIKPSPHGLYKPDGNLDQAKVDALFDGKTSITKSDVQAYLDRRNLGLVDRLFLTGQFNSGFQAVGKDAISREEFVRIMNGELMKEKIAKARAKSH